MTDLEAEVARLRATLDRIREVLDTRGGGLDPYSSESWLVDDIREALGETVEPDWSEDGWEYRLGLHVWETSDGWVYSDDLIPNGRRASEAWLAARPKYATREEAQEAALASVKEPR